MHITATQGRGTDAPECAACEGRCGLFMQADGTPAHQRCVAPKLESPRLHGSRPTHMPRAASCCHVRRECGD